MRLPTLPILPILIDCNYVYPQFAGAYLLIEGSRATFIETNTAHCVPTLLKTLQAQGLDRSQVDYVIITHVHLDHAGGTSALMEACPNATLLAHPRAAPHIIDPSRLVASAKKVYGEEKFQQLYGEIKPVDPKRVRVLQDEEHLTWGSRDLQFLHTRGHANHHFCVLDSASSGIFTGDSFGIYYPSLQKKGLFIFPSTSPTDFDPVEAKKTIHRILNTGAKRAFLTHFGELTDLPAVAHELLQHLDFSEFLLNEVIRRFSEGVPYATVLQTCEYDLRNFFKLKMEQSGIQPDTQIWDFLDIDIRLNAAGVVYTAQKMLSKK